MKRSPLKTKLNRERAAARFARQFHSAEFVEWMRSRACDCCYKHTPCMEVHHVKTRGAGGTWRDTVTLCLWCHNAIHREGVATFCRARGWPLERLSELAAVYAEEWEALNANTAEPV